MTWQQTHIVLKVLARDLLACAVLGLIFAFLGIYDTDGFDLLPRIAFWILVMCIGAVAVSVIEPLVFSRLLKGYHPALQISLIALMISLPITIFIVGLNTGFSFVWPAGHWGSQFVSVIIISVIISIGRYFIFQFLGRVNETKQAIENARNATDNFLERLPIKYRSAFLYAVSSEGHYLRVHTDRGSPLILMRISDAIRELSSAKGLQVHRSWWIAHDGIDDIKRENGRRLVVLKNNEIAPVSRRYIPALKSANLDISI